MVENIITIKNLNVWYSSLHALKNVSLTIPKHQITAFIGASGSGKSTLLRCMNRILDVVPNVRVNGQILFKDRNIYETDAIEIRRLVGMVFQNPTPFPKSIYDNVAYGLEVQGITRKKPYHNFNPFHIRKITALDVEQSTHSVDKDILTSLKAAALWDEVKDRLHISALQLSGGQQQRLCIARAIAVKPEVLLLDEPCSALDPISTRKIEELLEVLKQHYTIVIVTHNMQQAKRISDRVGFFHMGKLIEMGETNEIFTKPQEAITKDYVLGNFG